MPSPRERLLSRDWRAIEAADDRRRAEYAAWESAPRVAVKVPCDRCGRPVALMRRGNEHVDLFNYGRPTAVVREHPEGWSLMCKGHRDQRPLGPVTVTRAAALAAYKAVMHTRRPTVTALALAATRSATPH